MTVTDQDIQDQMCGRYFTIAPSTFAMAGNLNLVSVRVAKIETLRCANKDYEAQREAALSELKALRERVDGLETWLKLEGPK